MKYISSFPTHNEVQVPLTKKCVFIVSIRSLPCGKLNFRDILLSTTDEWKQNISSDTTTRRILRTSSFKIMPQRRKFHSESVCTSTTIFIRVQRCFEAFLRVKVLLVSSVQWDKKKNRDNKNTLKRIPENLPCRFHGTLQLPV